MSVNKIIENTILSFKTQIGTMSNGKPRYKTYSYSNIDVQSTDDNLYAVADALVALFEPDIAKIIRQDLSSLATDIPNP